MDKKKNKKHKKNGEVVNLKEIKWKWGVAGTILNIRQNKKGGKQMAYKETDYNVVHRTFNIEFPEKLIPVYDFLQAELDDILDNPTFYKQISEINIYNEEGKKKQKGHIWKEINDIIGGKLFTKDWNLGGNAWYLRIIIENIRRTLYSVYEQRKLYNIALKYDFKYTEDFIAELQEEKIYGVTAVYLKNMKARKTEYAFPKHIRLEIDYSISHETMFKKLEYGKFQIRISKDEWIDYEVVLPMSLRIERNNNIANPSFIKRSRDGKYIGLCAYEVNKQELDLDENKVLGVDLGFVKLFSAVAVDMKSGEISEEYRNSTYSQDTYKKIQRMQESKNNLKEAIERCLHKTRKQKNRIAELSNTKEKIRNSKKSLMKLIAFETIEIAIEKKCKTIVVENLGILRHLTGKWNYGEYYNELASLGEIYQIKIEKANPKNTSKRHPITREIGVVKNRKIEFKDGKKYDRDYLAAINLALLKKGKAKEAKVNENLIKEVNDYKKFQNTKSNKKKKLSSCLLRHGINKTRMGQKIVIVSLSNVRHSIYVLVSKSIGNSLVNFYRSKSRAFCRKNKTLLTIIDQYQ